MDNSAIQAMLAGLQNTPQQPMQLRGLSPQDQTLYGLANSQIQQQPMQLRGLPANPTTGVPDLSVNGQPQLATSSLQPLPVNPQTSPPWATNLGKGGIGGTGMSPLKLLSFL